MKMPPWYRELIAKYGAEILSGADRGNAMSCVLAAIGDHPEFLQAMVDGDLGRWAKDHESSGDLFQAALFPLIPVSMQVNPRTTLRVSEMTATDLDNAKRMLLTRTQNAIDGADRERAEFAGFYDKVRPLLKGNLTVAKALSQLAASEAA